MSDSRDYDQVHRDLEQRDREQREAWAQLFDSVHATFYGDRPTPPDPEPECGAVDRTFRYSCDRPAGHDGWHGGPLGPDECPCPDPLRAVAPRCTIHGYDR